MQYRQEGKAASGYSIFLWMVLIVVISAISMPAPLNAQGTNSKVASTLAQRGDLELHQTSLRQALDTISEIWSINIVLGGQIEGNINGTFKDAPLYEILDSILLVNGYGYRPVGDSLVIVAASELGASNPMFRSETFTLQFANVTEVLTAIESLKSRGATLRAVTSANSIIAVDYPQQLALIGKTLQQIDRVASQSGNRPSPTGEVETDILNYQPEYVSATSLLEAVQSLITADGRAAIVQQENQVVVIDRPNNLRKIRTLLERLDAPKPQVRITALIYDIGLNDEENLGINWNSTFHGRPDGEGNPQNIFGLSSALAIPAMASDPSGVMTFQTLNGDFDLSAVIDMIRQMDDSRLLADPNVVVVNREEAKIQIVTEVPYQQLTQTSGGGDIGTTAFREAGVTLTVTPRIAVDGTVELDVIPSFSRLTGFSEGLNPQPIIDRREAQTTVRVADGQVLVIGGLRTRIDLHSNNGIPYLKELKYIGHLFKYRSTEVRESELVVFLKTEILPCPSEMNCRHQDAYAESMTKLEAIPPASKFPWPKMTSPAPGVRDSAFGPDPRRQTMPQEQISPYPQQGYPVHPEAMPQYQPQPYQPIEIAPPEMPISEQALQRLPTIR